MRSDWWRLAKGELNPFSARALQVNVSFSFLLMCSCKGLLPQSSPSHLIHNEMTATTTPQQKMLWGCQCITSFFTFAPLLQQLYPGLEASGAADLPTPLGGNRTWSARLPRGGEGGCAAARDPSRPVRRSVRLLVGGAGDSAARRRLQLSFTLSLPPPSPVSLQGKKKKKCREG